MLIIVSECNKAINALKEPNEDNPLNRLANICTGPITGGVAACSGDSGGPLIQYISYDEPDTLTTQEADYTTETSNWTDEIVTNEVDDAYTTENISTGNIDTSGTEKTPVADEVQNYKDEGFIPVVIGVVSWGISPCGEVGAPTVYTNVTTYADFIYKHLYN